MAPGRTGQRARRWPERDRFELALAHRALERDMPLLGICRGMQMLNVPAAARSTSTCPTAPATSTIATRRACSRDHDVRLEPRLAGRARGGRPERRVKSHHHQGVDELGEGLVAERLGGPDDELLEAIEPPERRFALGVLWHPEEDERSRVVGALVDEARRAVPSRSRNAGGARCRAGAGTIVAMATVARFPSTVKGNHATD